jgi:outer membrane protein assembly factor BamB
VDSLVVASIWSPGAVVAVERQTGRPVWRRPFPPLAHDAVYFADGVVYAHNLHRLHAIEPSSGRPLWTWQPPGNDEEYLHASPVVSGGRLFIGDQVGRLWCLDSESGEPLWNREPAPAGGPINSTAIVANSHVMVTTNTGLAVAYDVRKGQETWRQRLDGPASSELLRFKSFIAVRTFWSVYLLDPKSGEIVSRQHWRGRYLRHLIASRSTLLVTTQRARGDMSMEPPAVLRASLAAEPNRLMVGLTEDGELFKQPCPPRLLGLRWSSETGLVYESRADGLGILDPATGERLHDLIAPGSWNSVYCGPVDIRDGTIYMLDLRGNLRALQHPWRKNLRNLKKPASP